MHLELTPAESSAREQFRAFVRQEIAPLAGEWDRQGAIPRSLIEHLAAKGYLGAPLAAAVGGGGMAPITYGLLTEAVATGCSSVRSLLTVHDMVSLTVARWAQPEAKEHWLPQLARGHRLAALALSEPEAGSDAAGVTTRARLDGDGYVIDGTKRWTTFGQIADLYLVLARAEDDKLTAFLVPAETPGLDRQPIEHMVGTRASMLAELRFDACRVGSEMRIGRPGFGLSHVIGTALDHGRYSVAWGAVGIAQACLDASLDYTAERQQYGVALREHQLVARKLTEMIAATRAARLLCYRAGHLRATGDPGAVPETMLAKYFASRTASQVATDAVQLHGANGLSHEYPLERMLRDAKVTEIIEGSSQIQQISIPRYPLADL